MNNKDELRQNIQNNLKLLRQKKGLTQVDIADETEKAATAVASWEQGKSLPDPTTLYHLSKFYHVPMEFFYENHGEDIIISVDTPNPEASKERMSTIRDLIRSTVREELDKREAKDKFREDVKAPLDVYRKSKDKGRVVKVDLDKLTPGTTLRVASADKPKPATLNGIHISEIRRRSRHEDS